MTNFKSAHGLGTAVLAVVGLALEPRAADLIVRPGGGLGRYATVQAAMNSAQPGDRILVEPGTYPSFAVTKSIAVIGLGSSPDEVVVDGIAFHPLFPQAGYRVLISRIKVVDALDGTSATLSGNELGTGQLELESIIIEGELFLGVGQAGGFRVSIANSVIGRPVGEVLAQPAAAMVSGPDAEVEISRSTLSGAAGIAFPLAVPQAALVLDRGARVRVAQSTLRGGTGAVGQVGAAALRIVDGSARAIHTDSALLGGRGGMGAAGGPAVHSDEAVFVGDAIVQGGVGSPSGPAIAGGGSILPLDPDEPALTLLVDGVGTGPVRAGPGAVVSWQLTSPPGGLVLTGTALARPGSPAFPWLMIDPSAAIFFVHPPVALRVPELPASAVGLILYSQGVALDAPTMSLLATTPVALRIDAAL